MTSLRSSMMNWLVGRAGLRSGAGGSPASPANVTPPSITGEGGFVSAVSTDILSCDPGVWSPGATSYAYQWYRDGSEIGGETNEDYALVAEDSYHLLTCEVIATNAVGSSDPALSGVVEVRMSTAYVASAGDDGTAVVNDFALPFRTVQGAISSLASNIFVVDSLGGPESNADMPDSQPYMLRQTAGVPGYGTLTYGQAGVAALTLGPGAVIDQIVWPAAIGSVDGGTVAGGAGAAVNAITAFGNGGDNGSNGSNGGTFTGSDGAAGAVGDPPSNGAAGEDAAAGGNPGDHGLSGGSGRSLTVSGVALGTVTLSGGDGGSGGNGGNGGTAVGGRGGDGGFSTAFTDPQNGGNGGDGGHANAQGGYGGNGGNGGNGGTLTLTGGATVTAFVSAFGAAGGRGHGGGSGSATGGVGGAGGAGVLGGDAGLPGTAGSAVDNAGSDGSDGNNGIAGGILLA